ncbi:MAG: hypothetical protein ACLQU1_23375 [Bryobacteraceae bacterium]
MDLVSTAAIFAGRLVTPELRANCFRLEYLVHLAVAYCEGSAHPAAELVRQSFERIGDGYCGMAEDPAEDVFVSLVNTSRGNFRIFEGIREGNGFHLQRVLNVIETMPQEPPHQRVRDCVESLLKPSDAAAGRAGLAENTLGRRRRIALYRGTRSIGRQREVG